MTRAPHGFTLLKRAVHQKKSIQCLDNVFFIGAVAGFHVSDIGNVVVDRMDPIGVAGFDDEEIEISHQTRGLAVKPGQMALGIFFNKVMYAF